MSSSINHYDSQCMSQTSVNESQSETQAVSEATTGNSSSHLTPSQSIAGAGNRRTIGKTHVSDKKIHIPVVDENTPTGETIEIYETDDKVVKNAEHRTSDGRIFKINFEDGSWTGYCILCAKYISPLGGNFSKHAATAQHSEETTGQYVSDLQWKLIRYHIYESGRPISTLTLPSFRALMQHKIYCQPTFMRDMEDDYNSLVKAIKAMLQGANTIALSFDEWTRYKYGFIGVVAHTPDIDILAEFSAPAELERTSDVLASVIRNIIERYEIRNKVRFIVSDCASVCAATVQQLGLKWCGCSAHMLQSCIKELVKKIDTSTSGEPSVKEILYKANRISDSNKFKRFMMQQDCTKKSVRSYIEIRWLSLSNTFNDIVELKQYITSFLVNFPKDEAPFENFTQQEYRFIKDFGVFLDKCTKQLKISESSDPDNIFLILLNFAKLCKVIAPKYMRFDDSLTKIFQNAVMKRLHKYENAFLPILCAAALLNPKVDLNLLVFPDPPIDVKRLGEDYIRTEMGRFASLPGSIAAETQDNDISSDTEWGFIRGDTTEEFRSYMDQRDNYGKGDIKDLRAFWKGQAENLPKLSAVALEIGNIPSSSASIERIFSTARAVLPDDRGAMSPETITKVVMLNSNRAIVASCMNLKNELNRITERKDMN